MNPWKGVVPYTENDGHVFLGRKQEIIDLLNLVKRNHIVTIYGRSGIGKTSLLNVGLFPSLIKEYYYPVSIRLKNICGKSDSFAKHITECINKELLVEPFGCIKHEDIPIKPEDDIHYLWNYFAYHEFYCRKEKDCIKEGDEVTPVIVLDQFEEVLRDNVGRAKAVTLINQIHSTLQDGFLRDGTPYTIAFRFVISLREDDLYLLEDLLDEQYIDTMKRGRFRLRPLDTLAAEEIIFIEPDLFEDEEGEKKRIIEKIVTLSDQEGQISTLLLSLVCFRIYESAKGRTNLRVEDINKLIGEKPLDTFYHEAVKELDNETIDWIESHFTKDDRKLPVSLDSIPQTIWQEIKKNKLDDASYDHHLFTSSSRLNDSVELLHDKLAVAMNEYRIVRLKEQKEDLLKRKIKRGVMIILGIVLVFASVFVIRYFTTRPVEFNRVRIGKNQVIPNDRQYKFKDGTLRLSKCRVLPNTFCSKDVRRLEIDSVIFMKGVALYLPNLDTLVLGGNDYDNKELFNDSIQSVKVLFAKRPNSIKNESYILSNLDTVIIDPNDHDYLRWHNSALYVRDINEQKKWYVKFKRSAEKPYYYSETFPNCHVIGADPLQLYDIADPPKKLENNTSIKLTCLDHDFTYLSKKDIPDTLKENVVIIELPYVDSIGNDLFSQKNDYYNNNKLQTIVCSNISKIGDSAFIYCKQLRKIELPQVKYIGSYAFYSDNMLKTIRLDSVRFIGAHAFEYIKDVEEIYLPVVDSIGNRAFCNISENTKCNYNPNASIGNNAFGYSISPINLYGKQGNLNNKKDELGYHYSRKKDTISIDSSYVANLEISKEVCHIMCSVGVANPCIDKISLHRDNLNYFTWKGDLYKYDNFSNTISIIVETNREKYVSLPSEINRNSIITRTSASKTKLKEYIALNPDDLNTYVGKDVVLWVPYKQRDKYFPWENSFAEIRELKWGHQVLCYKVLYGHPRVPLKIWFQKRLGIERSDMLAFLSCGMFMIALLLMLYVVKFRRNKKWWQWLRDVIVIIVVLFAIGVFVYQIHPVTNYYQEEGLSFHSLEKLYVYLKDNNLLGTRAMAGWKVSVSMWPIWYYAPEIWLIYLLLTSKFHKNDSPTNRISNSCQG